MADDGQVEDGSPAPRPRRGADVSARVGPFAAAAALLAAATAGPLPPWTLLGALGILWLALDPDRGRVPAALAAYAVGLVAWTTAWGAWTATAVAQIVAVLALTGALAVLAARLVAALADRDRERAETQQRALERAKDLMLVARIARTIAREGDTARATTSICRAARGVCGASSALLWSAMPDRSLTVVAAHGTTRPDRTEHPGPGEHDALVCARTRRRVFVGAPRSMVFEPIRAADDTVVGVLEVAWDEPMDALPERLGVLVQLIADEAASALDRAELLAELAHQALTDSLTGLPNRRSWERDLARDLARARREEAPLSVAVLDLDHFKDFNDEHGHPAGDRLLAGAAQAWSSELRGTDTIARLGGEEFAVCMPGCDAAAAREIVRRLRARTPGGQTCSAGIATWDHEEPAEALLARADRALYAAKDNGRDRTEVA